MIQILGKKVHVRLIIDVNTEKLLVSDSCSEKIAEQNNEFSVASSTLIQFLPIRQISH